MFDGAASSKTRIIAVDRPGMGFSDFKRRRQILDWPADVTELANHLKLDLFAVLGISGGGPYAAACAYQIPERLTHTAIVSGIGPADAPGAREGLAWFLMGRPSLLRWFILSLMSLGIRKNPAQFMTRSKESLPQPDTLILSRPEAEKAYIDAIIESFRNGVKGANHDAALFIRPWRFALKDIKTEVHLWHGELDRNVPVSVGRFVAGAIPDCRATFFKGEAHLSAARNHMAEILAVLTA